MKLRYVALIALGITIGPVGLGLIAQHIFRVLFFDLGWSFAEANAVSVGFIGFPFFLGGVWALTNMDAWDRVLKRITG